MKPKLIILLIIVCVVAVVGSAFYMMKKEDERIHKHFHEMILNARMPNTWDDLHMQLSNDSLIDANKKRELYFINLKLKKNNEKVEDSPYYQILLKRYSNEIK